MRTSRKIKVDASAPDHPHLPRQFYLARFARKKKCLLRLVFPSDSSIQFYSSSHRLKCHKIELFYYILHIITIYSAIICKFVFK